MELKAIESDIVRFLKSNVLAEEAIITPHSILKDLGIDSFSIVEIILFIERKYSHIVPESKLVPENFSTIESIAHLVMALEQQRQKK
jgi:acyl carrier protein